MWSAGCWDPALNPDWRELLGKCSGALTLMEAYLRVVCASQSSLLHEAHGSRSGDCECILYGPPCLPCLTSSSLVLPNPRLFSAPYLRVCIAGSANPNTVRAPCSSLPGDNLYLALRRAPSQRYLCGEQRAPPAHLCIQCFKLLHTAIFSIRKARHPLSAFPWESFL